MEYVNLTDSDVVMNDGRVFARSTEFAKPAVDLGYGDVSDDCFQIKVFIAKQLPPVVEGRRYIVAPLTMLMCGGRKDFVSPASAHPDAVVDADNRLVSVPGFFRNDVLTQHIQMPS